MQNPYVIQIDSPKQTDAALPLSSTRRYASVDALRGFDMFWIVGGDYLVRSLPKIHDSPLTRRLASELEHCDWAGFHFYDLIFPLFVWIVGVSITFSLPKLIQRQGRFRAVLRVTVRSILLFALGVFYMGGVSKGLHNVYLAGVLHRIAVAYFFAGLLFCYCTPRMLAVWAAVLLVGYWGLMTFVPVPGLGKASYEQGKNLAYYIDQRWLPGQKFEGTLLSTMPAVANCLLGVFGGLLLLNPRRGDWAKVGWLLVGGAISLGVGVLWSLQFPIIKLLWTSSYVLVACGISAMLLALFYVVIEIGRLKFWATPLVWIGMNAITIYMVSAIANFQGLATRIIGGEVARALCNWADFTHAVVALVMVLSFARFLYRRKIFLRL